MSGRASRAAGMDAACGSSLGHPGRLGAPYPLIPACVHRDQPCAGPVAQKGGQGMTCRHGSGCGSAPSRAARPARRLSASTSRGSSSSRQPSPSSPSSAAAYAPHASSSSSSSGSPLQPQSTVRSLGSGEKQMPWSQPWTVAVLRGQDVPTLAVGVVDQRVEHREPAQAGRRGSGSCAARPPRRRRRSTAGPCPGPAGPSRRIVGGTIDHPIASDTCQAATSRWASVPVGEVVQRALAARSACRSRAAPGPVRGSGPGHAELAAQDQRSRPP